MPDPAFLILEDGRTFQGTAWGYRGVRCGEVVFNTSMTGYQEILTDPSYAEQIVVMTVPHVGNYGVTGIDDQSRAIQVHGFVVREVSRVVSNHRADSDLNTYLSQGGVPGIEGIDTRSLTRHIRSVGAMKGIIGNDGTSPEELKEQLASYKGLSGLDLAGRVSTRERYELENKDDGVLPYHVVAVDFGIKRNIARLLASRGPARVTVVPAHATAEEILALKPDGVLLSNGPGDPEPVAEYAAAQVNALLGRLPVMGICMGSQVLGLALGGSTYKLKFGHRGGNQPVKNLRTGIVEITAQNHGFAVKAESLPDSEVEITHINLNDDTLEGFACKKVPAFAVQYHPEAAPGPHDAAYLFDDFYKLIQQWQQARGA
ncbi:MAG: glutamine-hydrolyzing carbamoyl-phosphate synthase small subunit [Deltaproteobacteria bacterium]|nr:glutamine-hydrolyzing carbamoyl-phosphate synthase small subunit [Deltaproteobacteria bacterium]